MEKVTPIQDKNAIEAEACSWIARMDGERFSDDDDKAFREWVNRSSRHSQTIKSLASTWGELRILAQLNRLGGPCREQKYTLRGIALAFGGLAAVVCLVWFGTLFFSPATKQLYFYSTAVGEQRTEQLPDGSIIIINTDTKVKVDYSREAREVRLLRGEAHFDVKKDAVRPFIVYAGSNSVRAVGTAFTVYFSQQSLEVLVTHGAVDVSSSLKNGMVDVPITNTPVKKIASVKLGQKLVINETQDQLLPEPVVEAVSQEEITRRLAWQQGILVFSGEPLEYVIEQVSRYTDLSISLTDPAVKQTRIGGYFKAGDTEAILLALETSFNIQVSRSGDKKVLLSSRQAESSVY